MIKHLFLNPSKLLGLVKLRLTLAHVRIADLPCIEYSFSKRVKRFDFLSQSLMVRDVVRDCLEKEPTDRTESDIRESQISLFVFKFFSV